MSCHEEDANDRIFGLQPMAERLEIDRGEEHSRE